MYRFMGDIYHKSVHALSHQTMNTVTTQLEPMCSIQTCYTSAHTDTKYKLIIHVQHLPLSIHSPTMDMHAHTPIEPAQTYSTQIPTSHVREIHGGWFFISCGPSKEVHLTATRQKPGQNRLCAGIMLPLLPDEALPLPQTILG